MSLFGSPHSIAATRAAFATSETPAQMTFVPRGSLPMAWDTSPSGQ
jgi:hypothetical protein